MQPTGVINKAISKKLGTDTNPSLVTSEFLSLMINLCMVIGCIIFVFMIFFGGYQWITSAGNKDGLQKAKSRITNALIGLVILLSLYAILNFLSGFFGLNLIQFNLPILQ